MSGRPLSYRLRRRYQRQIVEPFAERVLLPIRRWRNSGRDYEPVFVAGTMGSGTTLMALSLGQKYRCAGVVTESGHQVAAHSALRVEGPDSFDSVADFLESLEPREHWSVPEAKRDLLELYRGYAKGPSKIVIDKGPNTNLVRAQFLHECFPASWFVLVFRDPVAQIEGFRRKWAPFSADPLAASVSFYEDTYRTFLEQAATFRERVIAISYEALVARYDESLEIIAKKIGLEPAGAMRPLSTRPNVPGQGVRNVRNNKIALVKNANRRAYDALTEEEVATIESRLRPCYELLEREFVPVELQSDNGRV